MVLFVYMLFPIIKKFIRLRRQPKKVTPALELLGGLKKLLEEENLNERKIRGVCKEIRKLITEEEEIFPHCSLREWFKYHFHRHHEDFPTLEMVEHAIEMF